jgi:DNA polymerase I-like protein with 3'-5' exonuclease and polymerase domains
MRSDSDEIRSAEERAMFASLIQGSAAELTRITLVRLWQLAKSGELPAIATSTIHDEIQLDCLPADLPEVARITQRTAESFYGLFGSVPIVCALESSQTTWADKKHLE